MKNHHEIAEELRQLSRLYVNAQKYRNKYGNLLRSKFQFVESNDLERKIMGYYKDFSKIEKALEKEMKSLLTQHPWGEWFLNIKGVGPVIAASVIGELDGARYATIPEGAKDTTKAELLGFGRKFEKTSNLWAFAGFSVADGKAVRPKRGEKSNWNKYLKLACYKFAVNQIKQGDKYRKVYDDRKEYEQQNKELKKSDIHRHSQRYMIKKFLSDINHEVLTLTNL